MNGTELIDAVAAEVADTAHNRWSRDDVAAFVTRAMTWTVVVRPDANTVSEVVQLAQDSEQSISSLVSRALRYQGAIRNMGSNGSTPGRAIRDTDKATMDRIAPSWANSAPRATVRDCLFDPNRPDAFWAYPPIPATPNVYVELLVAKDPTEVTTSNEADTVDLTEEYREPVVGYATGLALRRNTDTGSAQLAQNYIAEARNLLGVARQTVGGSPPTAKGEGA